MEYTHHSEEIEITLAGTPAAIKAPRPRKISAGLRNYTTCYLCGKSRHVRQTICPCGQDAPTQSA